MMEGIRCLKLVEAILIMVLWLLLHINPSLSTGFNSGVVRHPDANMTMMRCIERERQALLAIKQGFIGDDYKGSILSSWAGTQAQNNDCCKWEGVICSNQTGHVVQLHLQDQSLQGKNISPKLIELQHLNYLDLSFNDFNGTQIPDFIGSLTNLRHLDLSDSNFGGQIPYQLGNLTHLKYLDLGYNYLIAYTESLNWLPHLSSLKYLYLSGVTLSNVSDWLRTVNKLPNLRELSLNECDLPPPILSTLSDINSSSKSLTHVDLGANFFNASSSILFKWLCNYNTSLVSLDLSSTSLSGQIPEVFENMSFLEHLDLMNNKLEGGIPHSFSKLCSLQTLWLLNNSLSGQFSDYVQILSTCTPNSLERLDLSENNISGSFPNLTNLLSLRELYLRGNRLSGTIHESIGQLSKLESIDLSSNSLEGVILETHFSKLSKLWRLDLSLNSLVFNINSDWVPPFQLWSVSLRSCKVGPHFPKWLQNQNNILVLDISDAEISDTFPSWFWNLSHNPTIVNMNLSHNQIRGTFENLTLELGKDLTVDLNSNQLEGPILSQALYLDLSSNKISGPISFLCESAAVNLGFLSLSSNHISGELPNCWSHLESLVFLDLSNNMLYGKIPTTIGSLYRMETLKLRSNGLVRELPSSLKNCTRLKVIDIGDNELSGSIPEWLGVSLPNLVILMLQSNHFTGSLPSQLCHLSHVQILDFSANNISGSIPKCLNNLISLAQKLNSTPTIKHGYLMYSEKLNSTPTIKHEYLMYSEKLNSTPTIKHEYLMYSENVPYWGSYEDDATFMWKGGMQTYKKTLGLVKRIDLSRNRLTGEIPSEITELVGLVSLNLSRNQLRGQIPSEIGRLQELDSLDLSRNKIQGRIPTSLSRIDRLGFLDLSYNNLFGEIPKGTQLQGFDPSVYAGNQLCGLPLQNMCTDQSTVFGNQEDKDELISRGFYISIGVGFVFGFWGACGSLIFISSWRYTYFSFFSVLNDWLYVRVALIWRKLRDAK